MTSLKKEEVTNIIGGCFNIFDNIKFLIYCVWEYFDYKKRDSRNY